MNNLDYKNLAATARILYDLTRNMQKIMLELFIDEFICLDEEEENAKLLCQGPPF